MNIYYTDHYLNVIREREKRGLETSKDYKQIFDNRTGYYIDGTKIETKHHNLHNYKLVNNKTNKTYRIDVVSYNTFCGKHISLTVCDEKTGSHKVIDYISISCSLPLIVDSIKQNQEKYSLVLL